MGFSPIWEHVEGKKKKRRRKRFAVPCVALNLTCTHDRSVRMLLLSGSPGEEHSNDLVTAMRKTVSSASFKRRKDIKVPIDLDRKCANLPGFQVLLYVHVWTDRRNCTDSNSCLPVVVFFSSPLVMRCSGHKQVMIYGIACWWTQSISNSKKIDVRHARSESGHSVRSQSQQSPSPLVLMLAYSLVSSPSILHPHRLPSSF